jgi:hypothetical protein
LHSKPHPGQQKLANSSPPTSSQVVDVNFTQAARVKVTASENFTVTSKP